MTSRFTLLALTLSALMLAAGVLLLRIWGEGPDDVVPRADRRGTPGALRDEGGAPDAVDGATLRGDAPPPDPVDAPLAADECAITGRVLHADTGEGLAGVAVHAASYDRLIASTVSGPGGRFHLRGLSRAEYQVLLLVSGGPWVNAEVARGLAPQEVHRAWRVQLRVGQAIPWNLRVLPGARIEGTVRDAQGAPVAGVRVRIPDERGPETPGWIQRAFPWHLVPPARTDDAGRFVLAGLPYGDAVLVEAVRDDGIAADSARVDVRPPDAARVDVTLPAVRAARIRVVDTTTGAPVPGAEVGMERQHGRRAARCARRGTTDDRGEVWLAPLSAEPSTVRVEALGYARYRSWNAPGAEDDAWALFGSAPDGGLRTTIALEPAAILAGRVVLPEDVSPRALRLHVREEDAAGDPAWHVEVLDAEGRFRLTVPPGRHWRLSLSTPYGEDDAGLRLDVAAASGDVDLVLRPERVSPELETWRGPVWDLAVVGPDGLALEAASATLWWQGRSDYPLLPDERPDGIRAVPDERGTLHVVVPVSPRHGPVWLQVSAEATGARLARVLHGPLGPAGGTATIVVPRELTIEGRVVDPAGQPVQGVEVEVHAPRPEGMPASWWFWGYRDEALTDAEGRFALDDVHAGAYELRVVHAGPWVCPAHARVEGGGRGVVIRLLAGVDVRVTVRDEAGAPIEGALVRAHQSDGVRGPDAGYWTSQDGAVTNGVGVAVLTSLERGGTYTLEVGPPKPRAGDLAHFHRRPWKPEDTEVVLPAFRTVAGRVRTPVGEPAAGALVILRHEPTDGTFRVPADADGRFAFDDLAPGAVQVGVCWPSLEPDYLPPLLTYETEAGDRSVELVLDPRHAVELDLTGLQGGDERVADLRLTPLGAVAPPPPMHRLSTKSSAAKVVVRGLAPGLRYRAWATPTKDGRFAWALVEPDTDRVALRLRAGGTVSGPIVWSGEVDRAWVGIDHEGVVLGYYVSDQPEAFTLRGVPPGTWPVTLRWTVDGETRRRSVDASPGNHVSFDLTRDR